MLMMLAVVLVKRKCARSRLSSHQETKPHSLERTKHLQHSRVSEASEDCSIKEMDLNSLIQMYRELPDNGKAELLDQTTASGSGHKISELSSPHDSPPIVHELMTHYSLDHISLTQSRSARDKFAIVVSTNMSSQSKLSANTSAGFPSMKTTISSSRAKGVDLDRSLPPTPISESVQISPIMTTFNRGTSARRGSETVLGQGAEVSHVVGRTGQTMP